MKKKNVTDERLTLSTQTLRKMSDALTPEQLKGIGGATVSRGGNAPVANGVLYPMMCC